MYNLNVKLMNYIIVNFAGSAETSLLGVGGGARKGSLPTHLNGLLPPHVVTHEIQSRHHAHFSEVGAQCL